MSNDGQGPDAALIQATDGNFYGTTYSGGAGGLGAVFRISPSGAESVVYSFGGVSTDGEHPVGALIQGSDGNLYGVTYSGGAAGFGTIFELSPSSGAETVLYSFMAGLDGANPAAGLVQGSDGTFYGTTSGGGSDSDGTVFALSPGGTETVLHFFAGYTNSDGAEPASALLLATNGDLYGTTISGGLHNDGTIFQISPTGTEVELYSFGSNIDDGLDPNASGLIQGSDGNFYGTTLEGGAYGKTADTGGTVFMYSLSTGLETTLYSFGSFEGDGQEPSTGLVLGKDGNFYGTTAAGGTHSFGTVFMYSPGSSTETVLYSFGSVSGDGEGPLGTLIETGAGDFYGTTSTGGANGSGAVFEIVPQ